MGEAATSSVMLGSDEDLNFYRSDIPRTLEVAGIVLDSVRQQGGVRKGCTLISRTSETRGADRYTDKSARSQLSMRVRGGFPARVSNCFTYCLTR